MKKTLKMLVSLMLAVVVVAGIMMPVAPIASAADFEAVKGDSDMWLVDPNTKKTASTIYLYGRADYICLKLKKDSRYQASFYFEMYSDKKYKKAVASYSTYAKAGTSYVTLPISFDDLKSGTYYAKTYVYKETGLHYYDHIETKIDPNTERTYKIVIKKSGTNSIKDMNTVMYGYGNTSSGPRVYWYSVPGATGYYLYRRNPKTGKYEKIKTVKDSGNKFTGYTDSAYKNKNASIYYKVKAYKGSEKTPLSLLSLNVKAYKTPLVEVETISDNRIKVSWSKVKSGASYTVYFRQSDSAEWERLGAVRDKLYYVTNGRNYDNNETYRFTVVAKVKGVTSGYFTNGRALRYLESPKLNDCTYPENGGITVNWQSVRGADSYIIYRKKNTGDKWASVGEVSGNSNTSYTDLTANKKDYYYYTVRSVRKGVKGSFNDKGVSATILSTPVLIGITEEDGQSIRLSWKKIPNDCQYAVMKKTTDGWKKIATTSDNYYIYDLNSKISKVTLSVRATRGDFSSDFDKTGIYYAAYPKVVLSESRATQDGFYIKWKFPENAEGSVIYKKTEDEEYTILKETQKSSLVDKDVKKGVKYTYKIAYKYKGRVVEDAAIEQPLCINTVKVECDKAVYNTALHSGGKYKSFTIKIKDYDAESQYKIYHLTDSGWVKFSANPNSKGEITVKSNTFSDVEKFKLVKITPQGDYTLIDKPDFTVQFVSEYIPETSVTASIKKDYPTIKWEYDSTKSADNIYIYRKAPDSEDKYSLVGVVSATKTSFVDKSAKPNCFYKYQLRVEKDGFITCGGPVVSLNYMSAPQIGVSNGKDHIRISCHSVSRAEKYLIYRKLPGDSSWTRIGSTKAGIFKDKDIKNYKTYMYMVKAVDADGNKSPGAIVKKWKFVPPVTKFSAKCKSKQNKLTWTPVSGADGYIIKYYDYDVIKQEGSFSSEDSIKIKGGTKNSYTDTNISINKIRNYDIRAYYEDYYGAKTTYRKAGYISGTKITSLKNTEYGVKVVVEEKEHVSEYLVYRKAPGETKWKEIGTISSHTRSYIDRNVKKGNKYYYTVKAVVYDGGTPIYSDYNKNGWSITYN